MRIEMIEHDPRLDPHAHRVAIDAPIRFMYLEKSITTAAAPTVCPARLVPPPRGRIGTPSSAAILYGRDDVLGVRGHATPRGSSAYRLASVATGGGKGVSRTSPANSRPSVAASSPPCSTAARPRYGVKPSDASPWATLPSDSRPDERPDRVLRAIDAPTIDHRGPDVRGARPRGARRACSGVFGTEGPVVIYPASGTGAWEAALVNTLSPGDKVIASETGHFATLWREMAERLGLEVVWLEGDWRRGADPERIADALDDDVQRRDGGAQRDLDGRDVADRGRARRAGRPSRAAARGHDLVARRASTTATTSGAWTSPSGARRRG